MNMTSESMMPGMSMMHMSFYWGKDVTFLFENWPGQSLGMYILSLVFIFLISAGVEILSVSPTKRPSAVSLLAQSCIYGVRLGLAYMVMLAVMSYNLGIFVVAVAGHAVGFSLDKIRATRFDNYSNNENNN